MSQPDTYVATLRLTVNDSRVDLVEHMLSESLAHLVETKNSCEEVVIPEARVVAVAPEVRNLELHVIPCISTRHLTAEVADQLEVTPSRWGAGAAWPNGFFLFLGSLEGGEEKAPQCLLDIRNWLSALERAGVVNDSRWIRLDTGTAEEDNLPVYDW